MGEILNGIIIISIIITVVVAVMYFAPRLIGGRFEFTRNETVTEDNTTISEVSAIMLGEREVRGLCVT